VSPGNEPGSLSKPEGELPEGVPITLNGTMVEIN
jgi:hypothetical protein